MKTNKIISIALLIAMVSTIGLTSVSASYGEWKGQGQNMTEEQREEIQNMSEEERQEYMEENWKEMQDDDGDGISNRDDDFEKSEDGENKPENAWSGEKPENAWNGNQSGNASDTARENASENSALKSKYKNSYEDKYGSAISRMNNDQLNVFIDKIDVIAERVETGDYSDETREKFNAMLDALREIATDNIDEEDLLDGLFE